jgi:predicted glycoside hydrolase/deacetylase ChbG (UPF0249 family)
MYDCHHHSEILGAIRELREFTEKQGAQIMIDLSKLQAEDAALAADVTSLATTIQTEGAAIQAAINALAALNVPDAATQAAIDAVTADLTTSAGNLAASITAVQGLPVAPTPPASTTK